MPAKINPTQLAAARKMTKKITDNLGGAGIFGVECSLCRREVYFSELSPRPHDTGLVTLVGQNLSQFELHLRAVLGLPIPEINYWNPSTSAVILAAHEAEQYSVHGLDQALRVKTAQVRLFGKPNTRKFRRMGV